MTYCSQKVLVSRVITLDSLIASLNNLNIATSTRFLCVHEWPLEWRSTYSLLRLGSLLLIKTKSCDKKNSNWNASRQGHEWVSLTWGEFFNLFYHWKVYTANYVVNRWIFFNSFSSRCILSKLIGSKVWDWPTEIDYHAFVQPFLVILVNYYYR